MTVAVAVKIYDGIVVATDSATTLPLGNGSAQVWNGADKIFQLHRYRPIAAMTWGLGQIGAASISTLAKDLRRRFMGLDQARPDWELPQDYTIEQVAQRLVEMMFDELYGPLGVQGTLGFMVSGFSAEAMASEAWTVVLSDPNTRPTAVLEAGQDRFGWMAYAQAEAIQRLFNGWDPGLAPQLTPLLQPGQDQALAQVLQSQVRWPAAAQMPLPDAIRLAGFMVDVTAGYTRFLLGPDTVGGPTEIAAITRHEGFKWINRKHYYDPRLNSGGAEHDRREGAQ